MIRPGQQGCWESGQERGREHERLGGNEPLRRPVCPWRLLQERLGETFVVDVWGCEHKSGGGRRSKGQTKVRLIGECFGDEME